MAIKNIKGVDKIFSLTTKLILLKRELCVFALTIRHIFCYTSLHKERTHGRTNKAKFD